MSPVLEETGSTTAVGVDSLYPTSIGAQEARLSGILRSRYKITSPPSFSDGSRILVGASEGSGGYVVAESERTDDIAPVLPTTGMQEGTNLSEQLHVDCAHSVARFLIFNALAISPAGRRFESLEMLEVLRRPVGEHTDVLVRALRKWSSQVRLLSAPWREEMDQTSAQMNCPFNHDQLRLLIASHTGRLGTGSQQLAPAEDRPERPEDEQPDIVALNVAPNRVLAVLNVKVDARDLPRPRPDVIFEMETEDEE